MGREISEHDSGQCLCVTLRLLAACLYLIRTQLCRYAQKHHREKISNTGNEVPSQVPGSIISSVSQVRSPLKDTLIFHYTHFNQVIIGFV